MNYRSPLGSTRVNFQTVSVGEDYVKNCPSSEMLIISIFPPCLIAVVLLTELLEGRKERLPNPIELCAVVAVITLGLLLFWYIQGRTVTIDESGVEWRLLFCKRRLSWTRIHDYGLSYAYWGQVRLYFSEERLESDGNGKKRLNRRCANVLLHIQNRDRSGQILNVCRRYTRIRPFLCSDEGKLTDVLRDR